MPSASFAVQVGSSEGVISVRYILASQRFFHHGACTEWHRSNGRCRPAPHRSRRRSCPSYTSLSATSDQTQCHCSAPLLLNGDIKPDSLPLRAISRAHNEWNWRGSVSSGTRNQLLFQVIRLHSLFEPNDALIRSHKAKQETIRMTRIMHTSRMDKAEAANIARRRCGEDFPGVTKKT